MFNKVELEGTISKIIFKNDKVIKAILDGTRKTKGSITITCFKTDLFDYFTEGTHIQVVGEVYDSNYQKDGLWINSFTVQVNEINI